MSIIKIINNQPNAPVLWAQEAALRWPPILPPPPTLHRHRVYRGNQSTSSVSVAKAV